MDGKMQHRCTRKDSLRPPCFMKALCDSNLATMATCWMVIPSAWLKLYGDEVGNSAVLHGPSGNTWQVGVGRPKWVAFRVGWRTFAADNGLEKGDFLVFTLVGKSEFSVKIFDSKTCLEKECALTATNTGCYDSRSPVLVEKRKQREDEENAAELKRICFYNNEGMQMESMSDPPLDVFRNGSTAHHRRPKLQHYSPASSPVPHKECNLLDLNAQPLCLLQNSANGAEKDSAEAHHHLMDVVGARTLQGYASGLIFQPHPLSIRNQDIGDDGLNSQELPKSQECASGGGGPATRFASQRRPVMDAVRERSSEFLHRQSTVAAIVTSEHNCPSLDLNREHFKEPVGPPLLPPAVVLEREKAVELARRAQQGIDRPSHLVALRAFHVHGRAFVRFPVTFGKQHMPRKTVPMDLLDENGHRWPMSWLRDNETHMGLTRGWREFCLAERLCEGDVCVFELIELNYLTLRVHVFRSTEPRDNTQLIIAKPKRPESGSGHQKSYERKRKSSEKQEKRRKKKPKPFVTKDTHSATAEGQHPCMPSKMVLYNAFHRMAVTSSTRPSKLGIKRRDVSPVSSVGRERLKTLSLWATKEQSKVRTFTGESQSFLERCSKDNGNRNGGDISKVQEAAFGEILCQMSSGCINPDTPKISGDYTARRAPQDVLTFEVADHNNEKVRPQDTQRFRGAQLSQVCNAWKDHSHTSVLKSIERKTELTSGEGVKPASTTPNQWAKTRKRYRKHDKPKKKRTWGWAWCTPSSAQKRKARACKGKSPLYLASRRSPVTEDAKERTKEAAWALITDNPAALVVLKNSHVYKKFIVELPPGFPRELSPGEILNIFLCDGAGNKTRALITHRGITTGWEQFSIQHLLEEGDVCVFELKDATSWTFFVHIFRVIDINCIGASYRDHYHVISGGCQAGPGRPVRSSSHKEPRESNSERPLNMTGQLRLRNAHRTLYRAIQKARAMYIEEQINEAAIFSGSRKEPLDLNLNLDPASESPSKKFAINSASMETDTAVRAESPAQTGFPSCEDLRSISRDSPLSEQENLPNRETTAKKRRRQQTPQAHERVVMPLPVNDEDSEPEEGNYYRVVKIHKKRYFRNEKQFLTELDGPVLQSDGCGGLREYDDVKWWVPEKFFSPGFASCYLR